MNGRPVDRGWCDMVWRGEVAMRGDNLTSHPGFDTTRGTTPLSTDTPGIPDVRAGSTKPWQVRKSAGLCSAYWFTQTYGAWLVEIDQSDAKDRKFGFVWALQSEIYKTFVWSSNIKNKRPAGHHNTPPRPRDRNFAGCILPWSLTFCSPIMVHVSRLLCILQILKSMLVASQHFFSLSKLSLRGYI